MEENDKIKVSLVVAIYKSALFLPKLIESILAQTHHNIEIILVDDGSPDKSGEICDQYAAIDSRIIVIHKTNGGACDARNKGMEYITGEYFSIIDGDDWLSSDYVEYLLNLAISFNADVSLTDCIFTTRDQTQIEFDHIEQWSPEEAAIAMVTTIPIGPWNKLYKTNFIKRTNLSFSVPWSGEGLYFTTLAVQYANKVAKGHRKIYNYRLNNEGSGLTNYNVQMGINALWNIKNISKVSPIKTSNLHNAFEWHIWKNYFFLYKLIVATHSQKKYWIDYIRCRFHLIVNLPNILLNGSYTKMQVLSMIKKSFFPTHYARRIIAQELQLLHEDKML